MRIFGICLLLIMCVSAACAYPQRIVSGIPSATEMLFALGLTNEVVGVTTNCNYPPEALKKEKVGGFFLNLEKVVSLKPDLVVMVEDAQKRDIEKFRDFGLNVYTINPHTVEDVMTSLIDLGKVTGREGRAEELTAEMRAELAKYQRKENFLWFTIRRPSVVVIVGSNPLVVAGGGTFIDDVVRHAGGRNIAADSRVAYPQYSFEKLLNENPECIIIPEGLQLDPRLHGKILRINPDILSRPGPRVVEAVKQIAEFIYGQKT